MIVHVHKFAAFGGLLALSALYSSAHAQVQAARSDPGNRARILVVRGDNPDPVEFKVFKKGVIIDVAPTASGRFVAAVVADRATRGGPTFRLHLMDESGATFRRVEHVQQFAFSPDERFVAVIRGHGYEGGPGFFPESVDILGLAGPDLGAIRGLEKATQIRWSRFSDDGLVLLARVYEGRSTVVEYIMNTRTVVPTDYRGLNFSPDGRYYYLTPGESLRANLCQAGLAHDSCVRVFARDQYRALPLNLSATHRRPLGWAGDQQLILANERNHDCEIYNVTGRRTEQNLQSVDWRWSTRPGFVVRRPDPSPNFRKLGKPQIRALLQ
ncbi:MAG: hypothetical protein AAFN74_06540 [Myxococcota bacterium]